MIKKTILVFSVILLLASCVTYLKSNNNQETSIGLASWSEHFDGINDLTDNSDIIIRGLLESSSTHLRENVVFTMNEVKITEVISGDINEGDIIDILQTGGIYESIVSPPIESTPLLKDGESYLLYLKLTDYHPKYGQYYLISGGYQGLALINDRGIVRPMDSNNEIFNGKNYNFNEIQNIADLGRIEQKEEK